MGRTSRCRRWRGSRRSCFAVGNSSEAVVRALVNGGAPIVQILLDHGADMEKVNVSGRSALSVAAAAGHEAVVRLLLERDADPNRAQDKNVVTPLMLAAAGGQVGVMAELIERGVGIDQTTPTGWTALMSAAWRNRPEALLSMARGSRSRSQ